MGFVLSFIKIKNQPMGRQVCLTMPQQAINREIYRLGPSITKNFIISGQTRVRVGQHYLQNQPDPKVDQVVGYCHSYH